MKKKLLICFLAVLMIAATLLPVYADTEEDYSYSSEDPFLLWDVAELLTDEEYNTIHRQLIEASRKYECNLVVLTYGDIGGQDIVAFADDFYDEYFKINTDGILLVVCEEYGEQSRYVSTSGKGMDAVTEDALDDFAEQVSPLLKEGKYAQGFEAFIARSEVYLQKEADGSPYRADFNVVKWLVISLIIGVILAFIVVGVMKGKLKSVRPQNLADLYVVEGSMNVTDSRDLFLYANVVKTAKSSSSSSGGSHTSSSGGSHGGGRI